MPRHILPSGRWAVVDLDAGLRAYVVGLPLLALALGGYLLAQSSATSRDLVLAGVLMTAGTASVEATRRLGEPAGTAVKDLLSAWWLPMAVLLPPVFVLIAPFPLMALTQWRVRPTLVHRRVFSAAAIGLPYAGASAVFHTLFPAGAGPEGLGLVAWAAVVAGLGLLAAEVNSALVAVAVKAADPQTRWRALLLDAENLRLDTVEASVGVTVAVLITVEPLLVIFMLPPVLLLQRGLLHRQLRAAAMLDPKTGLLNAPTWEREADGALRALRRTGSPAAVLLIDIDHFKRVNDAYGHLAGDRILQGVADALGAGLREGDLLGRFGGEEFVALLPAADVDVTAWVAERLRRNINELAFPVDGGDGPTARVTVSIGMATTCDSALSALDLLAAADDCMYQAKATGRNRVVPQALTAH